MHMIRNKSFAFGFLAGAFIFLAMNFYSYEKMYDRECFDCFVRFGWPLRLYETGGFITVTRILWPGLITDILLAITAGIAIGILNQRFFPVKRMA